ncbi:PREDICTED: uncharacterized protein LOC108367464 [Rhagoletis zephyria]|uniref:uncharacterized protein LOC108367464 n=1 Tax=Rhagoletis zephyria TaxID=28612 RepID=UPI0008113AF1|nr:PREDICTED: uncharacterized protein LOC108367464 [Rhagoletis zephyria]
MYKAENRSNIDETKKSTHEYVNNVKDVDENPKSENIEIDVEDMDLTMQVGVKDNVNEVNEMCEAEGINDTAVTNENICEFTNYNKNTSEDNELNEAVNQILAIDICSKGRAEYKIGEEVAYKDRIRFEEMFDRIYIKSERLDRPRVRKELRLVLESDKPFSCAPRRLSYSEKQELQKIIDEYLTKGYIRPSESEYVSPIVLVKKKTGELRMCVDYRKLNKVTAKDNYPIPLIDDLLDRLANKMIFTKLDLKNGFFHVYDNMSS